ncbi:DUF1919 domain-containing protein [Enterobacter mori]|uniref:DUF1919 domain-containing protein n=1 Tax=Enterobacter mori TaxID=539813 RepID=UPI0021CA3F4A|nr:DUF1919 domain-containing protein [Enterobacter mori]MCU3986595.1 DUF1919 domain-containing protein [Enterobacter mori]
MKKLLRIFEYIIIKIEQKIFNLILQKRFKKEMTIISSNCVGTRIYQSAKKEYKSPTINLWFNPKDFIKFTEHLQFYLNQDLTEYSDPKKDYPCGKLADLTIFFQHYSNFEEAKNKWEKRKKRILFDNILTIFTDRDGATVNDIKRIAKQKNVIIFCSFDKRQYFKSESNIIFVNGSIGQVGDLYSNYHKMLYNFPFREVFKNEK